MTNSGKVYATATEDMDALTFKTPKLLRKMNFKEKQPIIEIDITKVIQLFRVMQINSYMHTYIGFYRLRSQTNPLPIERIVGPL